MNHLLTDLKGKLRTAQPLADVVRSALPKKREKRT
jgi:hypothetical protein